MQKYKFRHSRMELFILYMPPLFVVFGRIDHLLISIVTDVALYTSISGPIYAIAFVAVSVWIVMNARGNGILLDSHVEIYLGLGTRRRIVEYKYIKEIRRTFGYNIYGWLIVVEKGRNVYIARPIMCKHVSELDEFIKALEQKSQKICRINR